MNVHSLSLASPQPSVHNGRVRDWGLFSVARSVHGLISAPCLLFLLTLLIMLFRPPDVQFYSLDRIGLFVLIFVVMLRTLALRQSPWIVGPVTFPMLALVLLALCSVLTEPYEPQTWSLFAAKWLVPFVLYHLAAFVFEDAAALRKFEMFALIVLAYLSLTAIFFLADARSLIFPRYILNESIGIHADRARGPFLQAVANGVTLNLLGLIAVDSFRRRRLRGVFALLFMGALPLAILATRTRAVWASFGASVLLVPFFYPSKKVKRVCLCLLVGCSIGITSFLLLTDSNTSLSERMEERGPVEFRMGMYVAGWEMFLDKPILGWAANSIQPELARRINDFHPPIFLFHNTYLEIAVRNGLVGLSLYIWVIIDLFRLGGTRRAFVPSTNNTFLDAEFRKLWPVLLVVYLVNASFVVMNYQFVNGLLFTIAGMLAAQNRRARFDEACRVA